MWHQSSGAVIVILQAIISIYGQYDMSSQILTNRVAVGVGYEANQIAVMHLGGAEFTLWQIGWMGQSMNGHQRQSRGSKSKTNKQIINLIFICLLYFVYCPFP